MAAASVAALAFGPRVAGPQQPAAPPAAPPSAVHGVVHGVVYDSLTRRPLAGATVQIVQVVRAGDLLGNRSVTADSAGAFRIDALPSGRFLVAFDHALLDLLRVELPPRLVEVGPGGDEVRVDLGVPGLAAMRPVLCGSAQAPSDSSGLLAGRVRDASDGGRVANATVVLTWSELSFGVGGVRTERRRVPVPTGPGGTYLACGVPVGVELVASAAAPGRASGEIALEVPPRGFVVRDLALGDTVRMAAAGAPDAGAAPPRSARPRADEATAAPVARGTARLTGTVRDAAGRPVRGARASARGTAASVTAGEDGTFALGGLPAGTRTLEVQAVGYAPGRVAVDLAPDRAATADVRLARVATLEQVTVLGTPSERSPGLREFLDRRRTSAYGRFLTAADYERWKPVEVTDALRTTGVLVVPNAGSRIGNAIRGTRRLDYCPANVFLDGLPLDMGESIDTQLVPGRVAGVEVYPEPAFAPPQYRVPSRPPCSVVLFWSRQ